MKMEKIEDVLKQTTEKNQDKVDWTKVWSGRYPILKTYQLEVDIPKYASVLREMMEELRTSYGYNEEDAMLVLKDILAHEYLDKKKKK